MDRIRHSSIFRRLMAFATLVAFSVALGAPPSRAAQDEVLTSARELAALLNDAVVICIGSGYVTVHPDGRVTGAGGSGDGENPAPFGAPALCAHAVRTSREDGGEGGDGLA